MIGQKVNNYEIVAQIGEGGMGTVYLARHPLIDRKAAIKVLRGQLAQDAGLVSRFQNEARAANAIHHPNIIDIIDVGMMGNPPTPYLMMEHLDGENLAQRIKRLGRLRVEDAIEFTFQTASALSAAHAKGIIHRDLKPENLFLVPDPNVSGREMVKVLDFGIAKLRADLSSDSVKTQTGAVMGTPPFMSPEQCRGINGTIDHRTDIYALGIIMYAMLCGAPPFEGQGFGDILLMHMTQAPVPPRQKNADIPAHIDALILRALAKNPAERFANMAELQAALGTGKAPSIHTPSPLSVRPAAPVVATPGIPTTFSATASEVVAFRTSQRVPRRVAGVVLGAGVVALGAALFFGTGRRQSAKETSAAAPVVAAPAGGEIIPAEVPARVAAVAGVSPPTSPSNVPDAGAELSTKPTKKSTKRGKAEGPEKW